MRKVTVEAQTRIGPVKADPKAKHAGYKEKDIGDVFTLDLDHPVDKRIYRHLFRYGAIKPPEDKAGESKQPETELTTAPPVVTEVAGLPLPEEDDAGLVEQGPIAYPTEEDLKPRYNLDTPLDELDILNEMQIEVLRRQGIEIIGDLVKITDPDLMAIFGIGPATVKGLREAHAEAEESYG